MKLKDIRESYGMTRAELERRIGVADRRLVRYESGETPPEQHGSYNRISHKPSLEMRYEGFAGTG